MTDTTTSIPQAGIELLEQAYTVKGRTEVLQFLNQHAFLVLVRLQTPEKIRQYFLDSQLFLEVVPGAEIINWVLLVVSILIKHKPNEVIERLN